MRRSGPDAPGSGTYEIRDFSLVSHYTDGRTVRHLITPIVNGDLRADNSRALIVNKAWARAQASPPPTPMPTPTPSPGGTTFDAVAFATPPGQAQRGSSAILDDDPSRSGRRSDGSYWS